MKPTLILVDDVRKERERLYSILWSSFDIVGEAKDGREAEELALNTQPDLALLDVVMPIRSGIEALRGIRARSSRPPRCVMLSSSRDPRIVFEAIEAGAIDYLLKPVEEKKLIETLRRVLVG